MFTNQNHEPFPPHATGPNRATGPNQPTSQPTRPVASPVFWDWKRLLLHSWPRSLHWSCPIPSQDPPGNSKKTMGDASVTSQNVHSTYVYLRNILYSYVYIYIYTYSLVVITELARMCDTLLADDNVPWTCTHGWCYAGQGKGGLVRDKSSWRMHPYG